MQIAVGDTIISDKGIDIHPPGAILTVVKVYGFRSSPAGLMWDLIVQHHGLNECRIYINEADIRVRASGNPARYSGYTCPLPSITLPGALPSTLPNGISYADPLPKHAEDTPFKGSTNLPFDSDYDSYDEYKI